MDTLAKTLGVDKEAERGYENGTTREQSDLHLFLSDRDPTAEATRAALEKETAQKIKKAETAGKPRLNQPSDTSIRNPEPVVNIKLSARDSDGWQLSDGQREYFKDSVVRDDDGMLIPA